jgi:anti-anti-sigma regulatory factor
VDLAAQNVGRRKTLPRGVEFLPLTVDRDETRWLIRLDGEFNVTSAAELKKLLLEGLASGKELRLDLEGASEIDVTVLQLLWAAGRASAGVVSGVSEAAAIIARDAGFERFPGKTDQE